MDFDFGKWAKFGVIQATLSAIIIFLAVLFLGSFLAIPFAAILVGSFFVVLLLALVGGAIIGILEGVLYELIFENALDKYNNYWKAFWLILASEAIFSIFSNSIPDFGLVGLLFLAIFVAINSWVILKIYDWREWRLPF